jgi:hypothetical protein
MKIFVSASPRCQADGSGLKDTIEFVNTIGVDFLNCASNTQQHIQLIQFLNEEVSIPSDLYDYVFDGDKIIQYLSGNIIEIKTLFLEQPFWVMDRSRSLWIHIKL